MYMDARDRELTSLLELKQKADGLWVEAAAEEEGTLKHHELSEKAIKIYNILYEKVKTPSGEFKIFKLLDGQDLKEFTDIFLVLGEAYSYIGRTAIEYNKRAGELYRHAIKLLATQPRDVSDIKINLSQLKIIFTKKQEADILWERKTDTDKDHAIELYKDVYKEVKAYNFQELFKSLVLINPADTELAVLQAEHTNVVINVIFLYKVLGDCFFDSGRSDFSSDCYKHAWDLLSTHKDKPEIFGCLEAEYRNNILFNFVEATYLITEKSDIAKHTEIARLLIEVLFNIKVYEGETASSLRRRKGIARDILTQLQHVGIKIEGCRDENVFIYVLSRLLDESRLKELPPIFFPRSYDTLNQLNTLIVKILPPESLEEIGRWINTENTVEQVIAQIGKDKALLEDKLYRQQQAQLGKKELRPYQKEAILSYAEKVISGKTKGYVQMATGCGKTFTFINLIKLLDLDKNLIVVPTKTIANQTIQELLRSDLFDERAIGLFDSDKTDQFDPSVKVIVTTYQSVLRQWQLPPSDRKLNFHEAKLIIFDEAHHALSKAMSEIVIDSSLRSLVLGFTATPAYDTIRDRQSLSELEELLGQGSCIFTYDITRAIDDKILCPVTIKYLNFRKRLHIQHPETTGLKKVDLSEVRLQKKINTSFYSNIIAEILGNKVIKITSHGGARAIEVPLISKKVVIFCAGIKHAQDLADAINEKLKANPYYLERLKVSEKFKMAAAITGKMDGGEQRAIIEGFKKGEIQFLLGCDILIEGFDEPSVEVVINLRPTYSSLLHKQRCGRGLRGAKDKTLIIIECTWPNIKREQVYFHHFLKGQQQHGTQDTFAILPLPDSGEYTISDTVSASILPRHGSVAELATRGDVIRKRSSVSSYEEPENKRRRKFLQGQQQHGTQDTFAILPLPGSGEYTISDTVSASILPRDRSVAELATRSGVIRKRSSVSSYKEPENKRRRKDEPQRLIPKVSIPAISKDQGHLGLFERLMVCLQGERVDEAKRIIEHLEDRCGLTAMLLQACSYERESSEQAIQMFIDRGADPITALLALCRVEVAESNVGNALENYTIMNNLVDLIAPDKIDEVFRAICGDEKSKYNQVSNSILIMIIKDKITRSSLISTFYEACCNNDFFTVINLLKYSTRDMIYQFMETYYQQIEAKHDGALSSSYPPMEQRVMVDFDLDHALLMACERGHFQIAKLLLEYNPETRVSREGTLDLIEKISPANEEEEKAKEVVKNFLSGRYAMGSIYMGM